MCSVMAILSYEVGKLRESFSTCVSSKIEATFVTKTFRDRELQNENPHEILQPSKKISFKVPFEVLIISKSNAV